MRRLIVVLAVLLSPLGACPCAHAAPAAQESKTAARQAREAQGDAAGGASMSAAADAASRIMGPGAGARGRPAPTLPPGMRRMKVGVFELPPYAIRVGTSEWGGVSVTLFREVAARLGLAFDLVEFPNISEALRALSANE